jgi:hypothetical protein
MNIHDKYLPFEKGDLARHFLSDKQLDSLLASIQTYKAFLKTNGDTPLAISKQVRIGRQVEKDERFWTVASLKAVYDADSLPKLLERAMGAHCPIPGLDSWESAVGREGKLYFEVGISSPKSYRDSLRERFRPDGPQGHVVPYVVSAAGGRTDFEGATKVDAVFVNPENGFAVMFEAKVLSDISCQVTFDAFRNQLARNIDVMIDDAVMNAVPRRADRTILCLLTPAVFQKRRTSR